MSALGSALGRRKRDPEANNSGKKRTKPQPQPKTLHERGWQPEGQRAAKRICEAIERERKSCEQQLAALEEQYTRHMWSKVHEVDALKKKLHEYETMIHALTNRMGQLSNTIRRLENQLYAAQLRLRV